MFDHFDNYWLNAPNKYICRDCEDDDEDLTYSFRSTNKEIIDQIKQSHPEIYSLFPCFLAPKNAIDKNLLNIIVHSAVKGIGPSAFREILISFHDLKKETKEYK